METNQKLKNTLPKLFREMNFSIDEYLLLKNNPGKTKEASEIKKRIQLLNKRIKSVKNLVS